MIFVICRPEIPEAEVLNSILFPSYENGSILDGGFFTTKEEAEYSLNEVGQVRKLSLKDQGYVIKVAEMSFIV